MNVEAEIDHHNEVVNSLRSNKTSIEEVITLLAESLRNSGTIMFCGNGGSASDSQHLAAEFIGRFTVNRKPIPALCLNTDTSVLTCIANDFSYDEIFSRQVEGLGKKNDILFCISTSGESSNILKACKAAQNKGIRIVALLGKGGGAALNLCDAAILVDSNHTARIQEAQIFVGHLICGEIERRLDLV